MKRLLSLPQRLLLLLDSQRAQLGQELEGSGLGQRCLQDADHIGLEDAGDELLVGSGTVFQCDLFSGQLRRLDNGVGSRLALCTRLVCVNLNMVKFRY